MFRKPFTVLPTSDQQCLSQFLVRSIKGYVFPIKLAHIFSTNQLSVAIPETAFLAHDLPPPKLSIAEHSKMENESTIAPMDCSAEDGAVAIHDDNEHSICETASVASDLTRMCVSDEEEKLMAVSDDENNR